MKKIECYTVKVSYKVLTRKQARELTRSLHVTYKRMVEKWTEVKLPPDWGKITFDGRKIKF